MVEIARKKGFIETEILGEDFEIKKEQNNKNVVRASEKRGKRMDRNNKENFRKMGNERILRETRSTRGG